MVNIVARLSGFGLSGICFWLYSVYCKVLLAWSGRTGTAGRLWCSLLYNNSDVIGADIYLFIL